MREISLDRLRTLVMIADLGSFAAAAQRLHLAPPTVSLHIAELERLIGVPLLLRKRGHVQPSSIGTVLVARARRLLAEVDSTLDDISRQVQGLAGCVRLGASTGAIAHLLPQAVAQIRAHYPDIDVHITVLTSEETLARLAQGKLDVGLIALPQSPVAGLTIRPWRRDPVMAFLPADWPAPARITPAWLATRPLILNDTTTRLSRLISEWFALGGYWPVPRIELNYNDAIKSLVAAGYGATLLPHEAKAPQLDARIAMRPLRPVVWRELGIAHRTKQIERTTQHVLDALWQLKAR